MMSYNAAAGVNPQGCGTNPNLGILPITLPVRVKYFSKFHPKCHILNQNFDIFCNVTSNSKYGFW